MGSIVDAIGKAINTTEIKYQSDLDKDNLFLNHETLQYIYNIFNFYGCHDLEDSLKIFSVEFLGKHNYKSYEFLYNGTMIPSDLIFHRNFVENEIFVLEMEK